MLPRALVALAGLILLAGSATAAPFQVRDQNPLIAGALPAFPQAFVPAPGHHHFSLDSTLSNTFNRQGHPGQSESLLVDGETAVTTIRWLAGVAPGWALGIDLPWYQHSGGRLDDFIDSYHHALGLPNGNRGSAQHNRLTIQHDSPGKLGFRLTRSRSGWGDVSIRLARALERSHERAATAGLRLQLPSGDGQHLLGSGQPTLSGWLASVWQPMDRWAFSADFGVVSTQAPVGAAGRWRRFLWLGAGALSWRATPALQFAAQLDIHGPVARGSRLRMLGSAALLTLGGTLQLTSATRLVIAVTEDIQVSASPDVALQIGLTFAAFD